MHVGHVLPFFCQCSVLAVLLRERSSTNTNASQCHTQADELMSIQSTVAGDAASKIPSLSHKNSTELDGVLYGRLHKEDQEILEKICIHFYMHFVRTCTLVHIHVFKRNIVLKEHNFRLVLSLTVEKKVERELNSF